MFIRASSCAILAILFLTGTKSALLQESRPATRPVANDEDTLTSELRSYLFLGRKSTRPETWKFNEKELADALIAVASDPRFISAEPVDGMRPSGSVQFLFARYLHDVGQRQRVAAAMLPLVSQAERQSARELAQLILGSGGEPAVQLLKQIVDGEIGDLGTGLVLMAITFAGEHGRFNEIQRALVFDLIRAFRRSDTGVTYMEVLARIDAERLSSLIRSEDLVARSHPEHAVAIDAALKFRVRVQPRQLVTHLDAVNDGRASDAVYTGQLLRLLAQSDPSAAMARGEAMIRRAATDGDLSQAEARSLTIVGLQTQLESKGANVACNWRVGGVYANVPVPEPVQHIRRALGAMSDIGSLDIGRYFAERDERDHAANDIATFREIGAAATADALQMAVDRVGAGGFDKNAAKRVESVRAIGSDAVRALTEAIANSSDDLFVLILRYQLKHADAVRSWHQDVQAVEVARRAPDDRGNSVSPTTDFYVVALGNEPSEDRKP